MFGRWVKGNDKAARLAALGVSAVVGAVLSPAFTLGIFVRSKRTAALAAAATIAWGMIRWKIVTADSHAHPEHGPVFRALAGRMEGVTTWAAISDAIVFTACCFFAGVAGRWLFDNHRLAIGPAAIAAVAGGMVVVGQTGMSYARADLARAQGVESGRINMIAESRSISNTIIATLAINDREKLLVGYAERLAARRGLEIDVPPLDFNQYIVEAAEGCEGAEKEVALCDNRILSEVRLNGRVTDSLSVLRQP